MRRTLARNALALGALTLPLILPASAAGQTTNEDLLREIQALKEGQQQLRQEIQALKDKLKAPAAAPAGPNVAGKVFDLGANPVKGDPGARLTLVEFTDYQ